MRALRTVHDHFHIADQTMDNFHGLRNRDSAFFHRQSVQPLEHRNNIVLSQ
jgi:hypothetical protein